MTLYEENDGFFLEKFGPAWAALMNDFFFLPS